MLSRRGAGCGDRKISLLGPRELAATTDTEGPVEGSGAVRCIGAQAIRPAHRKRTFGPLLRAYCEPRVPQPTGVLLPLRRRAHEAVVIRCKEHLQWS